MKKVFLSVMLGLLILGMVYPLTSFSQEELPSGCKIDRKLGITDCDAKLGSAKFYHCDAEIDSICGICCLVNVVFIR